MADVRIPKHPIPWHLIRTIAEIIISEKARHNNRRPATAMAVHLEKVYKRMDLSGLDPVGAVVRERLFDAGWRRV